MTNHMAEIAKIFGLELEEHFHITKKSYENTVYKFTKDGVAFYDNKLRTWYESVGALAGILTGETEVVKLPWKPSRDDVYYMPSVTSIGKYIKLFWTGSRNDEGSYQQGLVLRTKKEAVELAEEMLDVARKKFAMAKEARDND